MRVSGVWAVAALVVNLGVVGWAVADGGLDDGRVVWAALVVALALACGAVAGFGLRRLAELSAAGAPEVSRPLLVVAALVLVGATVVSAIASPSGSVAGGVRGVVLVLVAGVSGAPAALGLVAVWRLAVSLPGLAPGERAERLRRLRETARRLLAGLGSLVSLTTVALGASRLGTGDALGPEVLLFGGAGTALVGVLFALPYGALQDAARGLAREIVPLTDEDLPARLAEREAVERALGLGAGITGELTSQIAVAGPVLAAAAALFVSGG